MRVEKGMAAAAMLSAAFVWPAVAEADGNHAHFGDYHFDPLVGGGIAVFVGLITLMFVGQWIRFNAARRAAGTAISEEPPEIGEEGANGDGQQGEGWQQEP